MYKDLRDFLRAVDELGELKVIEGAHWDKEIGALGEICIEGNKESPTLLFDKIPGYPAGYRVAHNVFASERRIAIAHGLPAEAKRLELVRAMRDRLKELGPLFPPVEVKNGPIMENVLTDDDVDLYKFPTPIWHELDGGRYIGTAVAIIQRDPDSGYVNLGTYRVLIHNKTTAIIGIAAGRDGDIIQGKYWARGQNCPVVAVCSGDPMMFIVGSWYGKPHGVSEIEWAGAWKGEPIEVIRGPFTGLPIPAKSEIVLEGEMVPPQVETKMDGPWGENAGYYVGQRPRTVFRVKTILHRNDPILMGAPTGRFPLQWSAGLHIRKAAELWRQLDQQIAGVCGVWMIEEASVHRICVISLKQNYPVHAKQAALIAAGSMATSSARLIVVVDDDIVPSNLADVLWALGTRLNPETGIQILRDYGVGSERSMALLLACRPYGGKFPSPCNFSAEYLAEIKKKWNL